jgi:zinc/manganese transport system ATP-binding protein
MADGTGTVTRERTPRVVAEGLTLRVGGRELFSSLDFALEEGEFLAVLGPNGAGKTSLIRILLGLLRPSSGSVKVDGRPPSRSRSVVGYVPQQRAFDRDLPLRGRDLVRLGLDGDRWGGFRLSEDRRNRLDTALAEVGASTYAEKPIGLLSGGEQQRLRIAQALVSDPKLLLVDEPLLSLDLASQRTVVDLLDAHRREARTPVVFVTHDINPVLRVVDKVLYLTGTSWASGPVDEVMRSETLSRLYRTEIDVIRVRDQIVVVGAPHDDHHEH